MLVHNYIAKHILQIALFLIFHYVVSYVVTNCLQSFSMSSSSFFHARSKACFFFDPYFAFPFAIFSVLHVCLIFSLLFPSIKVLPVILLNIFTFSVFISWQCKIPLDQCFSKWAITPPNGRWRRIGRQYRHREDWGVLKLF